MINIYVTWWFGEGGGRLFELTWTPTVVNLKECLRVQMSEVLRPCP